MQTQEAVLGQNITARVKGGRSQGKSKPLQGLLEALGNSAENHERLEQAFHNPKTGKLTR